MTVNGRMIKDQLYEQFARVTKAMANPHRLELLDLLSQGERTVESLARVAGLTVANTSQHLQVLSEARLVRTRRAGSYVYYSLADEGVLKLIRELQALCRQRLAEVDQVIRLYFEDRGQLEPVDTSELIQRVQARDVIVLDVRPFEEYCHGHIPNALSIPLEELEQRLSDLPKDKEVVAYCRGPYCVLAVNAVKLLRSKGYTAYRLEDGVQEWRIKGLPIVVGESPQ